MATSTIRVGGATVDRVEEHRLRVPLELLTDDEALLVRRVDPLPSGFRDRVTGTFEFSNHCWVLRVDGMTVLIDPCTGNDRSGLGPAFDGLQVPFLDRLAAVGVPVDAVDMVFCTHLHHDHCGWNTVLVGDRWVPTFPRATYVFTDEEVRRWDPYHPPHPNRYNPSVFTESVAPVIEAGQARIVTAPVQLSPGLTVVPGPGHTLGHAMLRLTSEGEYSYFTGDAFHHPVQLTRPELHLPGCDDLATAIATRRTLVRAALAEEALLFPAHFPEPHHGRVVLEDDEVRFVPGALRPEADLPGVDAGPSA